MNPLSRRDLFKGACVTGMAVGLAGCETTGAPTPTAQLISTNPKIPTPVAVIGDNADYTAMYAAIDDKFPVPTVPLSKVDKAFLRRSVAYRTSEPVGTIVVEPHNHYLYFVQANGQAMRYGVGVGRQGFGWSGAAVIKTKQEWPDWYPPKEMLDRQPDLKRQMSTLQSGIGMHGGPHNPLGARAMYLWQGNTDTLFRIHGTTEPWTIGKSVSSGCIRMINQDAIDLYQRVPPGTRVVVLGNARISSAASGKSA